MFRTSLDSLRRGLPTIAVAGALVIASATSGATAALVITGKQIKNNTVTSQDIKNRSLSTRDLKPSTVTALKGQTGPAGAPGAPGISGYQVVTASAPVAADSGGEVTATCPAGKKVLSAAGELANSYDGTGVSIDVNGTSATAYAANYDPMEADVLNIDLVCAFVS